VVKVEGALCGTHRNPGALAPQVKRKAAERQSLARAQRLADLLDVPPCDDVPGALMDLGGRSVALVSVLGRVVSELEEVSYRGGIGQGQEQVRGESSAYLAAMARAESILGRILSLNLESRRVASSERDGQAVLFALEATLDSLDLPATTLAAARERLGQELTKRG
jgi:hypothetical protein